MNTIKSKVLLGLVIIFFIVGFTTSAKSLIETRFGNASAIADEPAEAVNPLSVIYPANLQQYRAKSKDYVESFSKKKREYIIYIFEKGENYLARAAAILDERGMPAELEMIPALESQFNSWAISSAGAVGYYQFMGELAREYGLHIGGKGDERKNFTKSTIAASKFFKDQLSYFNNDLLLSVASYNCGPGRVKLAIKRSGRTDPDFWDIKRYLPFETRKFVMDFIAFNVIGTNYDKFLNNQLDFNEPQFIQVETGDSTLRADSMTVKAL
jgi:membrane-bound lytic murein transglycosylase D